MASDIWLRTILIVRKETCCGHIGYPYRLTARVLLYAPSHRQDNTYHKAFVTPVVEHWLEREIDQWIHPMKDRSDDPSHHERTLLPRSYISLPWGFINIRYKKKPYGSLMSITINIESLMSCHLLLNLLHELANMILCEALPSIISFLPTNVINLVINDNEFEILFIT